MLTRNAIETALVRAESHGPAPAHVAGAFLEFAVVFEVDGVEFSTSIWAIDQGDAERRCAALRRSAQVSGQIYSESCQ